MQHSTNDTPHLAEHSPEAPREVDPALIETLREALAEEAPSHGLFELIQPLHIADQAEIFNQLSPDERHTLAEAIKGDFDHAVLPYLSPEAAEELMAVLGTSVTAEAITHLELDDAVHVIEDLSEADQQEILEAIPEEDRAQIEEVLSYPEESAGRLMSHKFVSVPEVWTVGETIDFMRQQESLPDNFYVIYAVDEHESPAGRVLLGKIMQHKRDVKIAEIMDKDIYGVSVDTDQEEVAQMFRKYGLVETAVLNDEWQIVGTITVDDVVDVIQEEAEEDFLAAGGVSSQDIHAPVFETARRRFLWLFINLLTAVLASVVIGAFKGSINQLVTLAVLMPIVASMGGNAGIQSVTVSVRALATKQLSAANALWAVRKELVVGALNGLALGVVMGGGVWVIYGDATLGMVFCAATFLTLVMAGIAGALIPLLMERLGYDPAITSGVFLTTVTDVVGFFSFLGLATLVLLGTH